MDLQRALVDALQIPDEDNLDPAWSAATERVREFVLRPSKRIRPRLLLTGYAAARPGERAPEGVRQFAAGLELLQAFLLIHDDVADRAELRRGGPSMHCMLAPGRSGEDLAVVVGDHLFARALELMLGCGMPAAPQATRWLLGALRHTAVGQFLDLSLARTALGEARLFQLVRVASLKTAHYTFVAPLVCGAMLGGARPELVEALARAGRHAGLAFQLGDDLQGLFGDASELGKSGCADFVEAKVTFPVLAAWTRGGPEDRARLEALWSAPDRSPARCAEARAEVERLGGRRATERVMERALRLAEQALAGLPETELLRAMLRAVREP